jgi:hypothetical protein
MDFDAQIAFHAVIAAGWSGLTLSTLRDIRIVPTLERATELGPPDGERPAVSVVVPVRDEAARMGGTLERLRAQEGVELEIIVVDDRSQDDTPKIVAAAERADARIRHVRVDTLPDGWLGKPHACQRGAEIARHPWILFTDGDIALAPDVLARAIRVAELEEADHVVLAPGCPQRTLSAEVAMGAFASLMLRDLARANRDARGRAVGIGAFNLVKKSAWHAIGEHRALAFEVVDDMRLGLLLARAGFRTRARIAVDDVRAEWGGTLRGITLALEKNMFAHLGYSVALTLTSAVLITTLWLGALTGPLTNTPAGWIAFAAFLSFAIPGVVMAKREKQPVLPAVLAPFGFIVIVPILLGSMITTLRRGGVQWRGRLYPLAELRARRVRA